MNTNSRFNNDETRMYDDNRAYPGPYRQPKKDNTGMYVAAGVVGAAAVGTAGYAAYQAFVPNEDVVEPQEEEVKAEENNEEIAKATEVHHHHHDVVDHSYHPWHHYYPFNPYVGNYYDINYNFFEVNGEGDYGYQETGYENGDLYGDNSIEVLATQAVTTEEGYDMNMALLQDADSGEQAVIVDLMDEYGNNVLDGNADFLMTQDGEVVDLTDSYVPMPHGSYDAVSSSYNDPGAVQISENYDDYNNHAYNEPSFQQVAYNEPVVNEPTYDAPSFDQPSMDSFDHSAGMDAGGFDAGHDAGADMGGMEMSI